jgi:AcrR family transcriptional regulator
MAASVSKKSPGTTTEAKIKAAARVVFHKKGYAGTRTRDIASEADMNLALLNYYFKSKKHLFEIIMLETVTSFFQTMGLVFNDENTSLEKKIQLVTEKYIELIMKEPQVPLFMMSEIRNNGAAILNKLPAANLILNSVFIKQFKEGVEKGKISEPDPMQFLMNIMGLVVFPFIASPLIKKIGKLNDQQFELLMQYRKKRIPVWIEAMLK